MPELPDVSLYCERIHALFAGQVLRKIRVGTPFVLRTYDPPVSAFEGKELLRTFRIGKRVCLEFEAELFCVIHLMIAGRLKWRQSGAPLQRKATHLSLDFDSASIFLTEVSSKKRASVHLFRSQAEARALDRGGIDPMIVSPPEFRSKLREENRTLKRALCDPRLLSGIGNAYSDEILFWAQLSPVTRTQSLSDVELDRLFVATRQTLSGWTNLLRRQTGEGFPEKVTAFHEEMAVHGRFKKPCRVCGTAIQRIRYASNETNYCPRCQTEGKLLADRSLSRLLRGDWPKSIEEL